jgi:hypothetical protein
MSFPESIDQLTLRVTQGSNTFEQPILSASLGSNSIPITNTDLINALNNQPDGSIFNPSIIVNYESSNFSSGNYEVSEPSSSNYVPKKITPSLSLDDIPNKLTTDVSFSVASLVSKTGTGVLSYSISGSDASIATINSSTGQVAIIGSGTTTITVSLAASVDQVYTAATPVSKTVTINKAVPTLSLSSYASTKIATDGSFSFPVTVTKTGTGVLSYVSSDDSVADVDESTGQVTVYTSGSANITVSLPASSDGVWDAATSVILALTVNKAVPTLSLSSFTLSKFNDDLPFLLSDAVTITTTGTGVLSYASGDDSVATVDSSTGEVTIVAVGLANITVSLPASSDGVWDAATSVLLLLEVESNVPPTWQPRGGDIDGEAGSDFNGYSVSLSSDGTILAIGATLNDGNGSNSGHVRVYQYDANKTTAQLDQSLPNFGPVRWNRLGADIDGEAAGDQSGTSVSLSSDGTILAVGAISNSGNGQYSGHVRVYQWNGSSWQPRGGDINGETEWNFSGFYVSLSSDGTILAVGAISNDGNGSDSGHVRVYEWNGPPTWQQRGGDIDGESAGDQNGFSVSLSSDGNILAIGARDNDGNGSNSGHVRVYQYDANKTTAQLDQSLPNFGPVGWNRLGGDIDGEVNGDESGYSVSLSSDGTILAIGAINNDGNGTGSGHVRVYQYDANKTTAQLDQSLPNFGPVGWNRLGVDIDGEAVNDQSGYSVSLSSDGTILAVGARYNDGNGSNSGHVRVYRYI